MDPTIIPPATPPNLVARAKAIILTPDTEWQVIDREAATVASLYRNYIMILAAIPPAADFLHGLLFGYGAFGFTYHPTLIGGLTSAIVRYVLTLASAFVLMLIIDGLAPTFQGQKSQVQALKLVAYASTASWLAGAFHLVPVLGILAILGLYSVYLFWRGLPVMMKSPPEKSLAYTAVIIIAAVVVALLIAPITVALVGRNGGMGRFSDAGGSVTMPTGAEIQLNKIQQATRALEASTRRAESGNGPGMVSTDTLKELLPASLAGGLSRGEVTTAGGQIAGFGGSTATATYSGDGHEITLAVADLGAMGALAGFGSALGVSGDKETATSYARLTTEDGRTIAEEYDRTQKHGSYGMVIASRFMVHAEGSAVTMDDLRAAVASVDTARLEALGK